MFSRSLILALLCVSIIGGATYIGIQHHQDLRAVAQNKASPSLSAEFLSRAWGLGNHYGVNAVAAWKEAQKRCEDTRPVVAVVDTGIDPLHPALRSSLWVNAKEQNGKPGIDDDGNGFVDDLNGWDFVRSSPALVDQHGHGTHISGIIAANEAGSNGLKGVCPGAQVMALRYYDEKASGAENLKNTIRALKYAVDNGALIINYSGGGAERSSPEQEALKSAEKKGVLVVAAAGNERSDADKNLYFPSAYNLSNILSVTAIDSQGKILSSSNWGKEKVHIAAPGNSILSALPNGAYGYMTGTSQATAFVSGIAALIMAQTTKIKFSRIREFIENSGIKSELLNGKTKTSAYASADEALRAFNEWQNPSVKKKATKRITVKSASKKPKKNSSARMLSSKEEQTSSLSRELWDSSAR